MVRGEGLAVGQQPGHEYLDPYFAHGKYRSFEEAVVGLVTRLTAKEVFVNSSDFFITCQVKT